MSKSNSNADLSSLMAFTANLAALSPDEIRKAKRLYIANAIAEYEALKIQQDGTWLLRVLCAIIPVGWPVLISETTRMKAERHSQRQKILNALEIWRDDLGESYDELLKQVGE
ncbi:hypothetical protein GC163_14060 [bacterium]|nr:hypothetical protein [bacterium]